MCVSFSTFFSFLPIIQTYSAHFSFFTLFSVFRHNPVIKCLCLIFHVFFLCVFFPTFQVITGCISHFSCFSMFLFHISCSKVCVFQFPRFSIFSPNSNPKVSISHFSHSSLFFAKFQVLQCVFLIVNVFQCLSPYSRSDSMYFFFFHCFSPYSIIYSVCVSFSTFFFFFTILQVLHCAFLIFHIFQFSRHILDSTVCIFHFPCFSLFFSYSRY